MVRRVFLAFLVFGLAACSKIAGPEDVAGIYILQTINGAALPAIFSEIGAAILVEITAGSVTLDEDTTCSVDSTFRETEDGNVTTSTEALPCTFRFLDALSELAENPNGPITLRSPAGEFIASGSIAGSILTLTGAGGAFFEYRK